MLSASSIAPAIQGEALFACILQAPSETLRAHAAEDLAAG
jgi:hypothetical protein